VPGTMISKILFLIIAITASVSSYPKNLRLLFPQDKLYVYEITATQKTGTVTPRDASTSWSLEGRLTVQVLGNESQVRFQIEDLKTAVNSENDGYISYQLEEAAQHLKLPWIVDYYKDLCLVEAVYLPAEPTWVSNFKRALSLNFQLKSGDGYYTSYELCIHDYNCFTTYLSQGDTVKKYNSLPSSPKLGSSWKSVPWTDSVYKHDQYLWNTLPDTSTMLAERVYKLDNKSGLITMEMSGSMKYRSDDFTLFSNTELRVQYEMELQATRLEWPKLTRYGVTYDKENCADPSCGIMETEQEYLRNKTYDILLKISKNGIETDNIVKDPSIMHNNDFITLLNTMSQLNYTTLKILFEDLVLGTSYELETSRNIFLEVLPYAGTDAAVKFVKHLVLEENEKIEDSALLSLIRKLPFNTANYSQQLLQELEPLTKLGLDYPQEIRHAAILSYGTMLHQAKRGERVGIDYFDNMVVKYLRMYSDCPHYMDRLVWLQGLCNIGYSTQKYTMEIYSDTSKKRNERLWAAFASNYIDNQSKIICEVGNLPVILEPVAKITFMAFEFYVAVELLLPVLTNVTEDAQIRMAALHTFLTATTITQNDFLFVHKYVTDLGTPPIKRFWYTAIKSLESNRNFDGYKLAALFLPSVSDMIFDLDPDEWATNNVISTDDDHSTSLHLLSMADDTGLPSFAGARLSTGGKRASVYIVAEGVSSNMYKRMHAFNNADMDMNNLIDLLKGLKLWANKSTEKVHVDFVFKLNEKAVYVAHMNQSRFDSWNLIEIAKFVNDFLRLGSHINQQVVYYPARTELTFPNELGIPVRLQTTSVSFTSLRGNLTTPATDLHIRYQGMSLTSLSSFGLLVQSEHSTRIQKSMIAHLPIKFNVSHTPVGVFNLKTDFVLPVQNGGVVIHTQTQVEKYTRDMNDLFDVRVAGNKLTNDRSIFSQCKNSTYRLKLEDLYTRNMLNLLQTLQPSRLILKAIPLAISPPSSSCGAIHLNNAASLDINRGLKATLLIEKLPSIVDFFSGDRDALKTTMLIRDYRQDNAVAGELLNLEIDFEIRNMDRNIVSRLEFNTSQSVRIFIENNDYIYTADEETPLDSQLKTLVTAGVKNSDNTRKIELTFGVEVEKTREGEKRMRISFDKNMGRDGLSLTRLLSVSCLMYDEKTMQLPQELSAPLYFACMSELLHPPEATSAWNAELELVLKEGITSMRFGQGPVIRLRSPEIVWWMDNWITIKKLATFGLYKECRIKHGAIQTLSGAIHAYTQTAEVSVPLADCTHEPRFAILRQKNGSMKIYAGAHSVSLRVENDHVVYTVNSTENGNHFRITKSNGGIKVQSRGSGIQLYYRPKEVIILVPNSHLHSACGVCDDTDG
ncbi:hypothetical protein ACJJTC_009586, partial [Scirpophaga incertulas]